MVKVVKTEKDGSERVMLLEPAAWATIVKKPHLVPGVKWRLWVAPKAATTKFVEVPIDAEVEVKIPKKKDKPEPIDEIKPVIYGEKEYKSDLVLGKKSVAEGDTKTAKEAFTRTLQLKPKNPYVKGQLKKL